MVIRERMRSQRGFSFIEILIVIGLIGILGTVVMMNFKGSDPGTKAQEMKGNLVTLRQALDLYKADHGWYPCQSADWNAGGDATRFMNQMTSYTNAAGQTSVTKSSTFRYGPYLRKLPPEPFSGLATVSIDTTNERPLPEIAAAVSASGATGGWFYEARSGTICGNLGEPHPAGYAPY